MSVVGVAPYSVFISLRMVFFLVPTFFLVFSIMCFIRQLPVWCDANIHLEVVVG